MFFQGTDEKKACLSPSARPMTQVDIDLGDWELKLEELEPELKEINANNEKLQRAYRELLEYKLVLEKEMSTDPSKQVKLGFINGLVPRKKSMSFERIIFHATSGNVFLKQVVVEDPITDPVSGEKVEKNVFVVFYAGEIAKKKILKICEAFGANRYPFPDDLGKQAQLIIEVSGRLSELKTTIDVGLMHCNNLLRTIGYQFEQWNLLSV